MKDLTKNPFGKFNGNEQKYAIEALDSDSVSDTPFNQRFEEEFAKKFGCKYAIACNSGTSGLHAAVFAAGIKRGDEVITSGGIIGTVERVMEDDRIEVTIGENTKVQIIRSTITSLLKKEEVKK